MSPTFKATGEIYIRTFFLLFHVLILAITLFIFGSMFILSIKDYGSIYFSWGNLVVSIAVLLISGLFLLKGIVRNFKNVRPYIDIPTTLFSIFILWIFTALLAFAYGLRGVQQI